MSEYTLICHNKAEFGLDTMTKEELQEWLDSLGDQSINFVDKLPDNFMKNDWAMIIEGRIVVPKPVTKWEI